MIIPHGRILDVGGCIKPYAISTHCIDILDKLDTDKREYIKMDICSEKWPYPDKYFDFIYCSNVLEDVKDPAFVIKEMERVGKSGIIIVPSPYNECTKGVDNWPGKEKYAGYCHHRWIIIPEKNKMVFLPKMSTVSAFDYTEGLKGPSFIRLDWSETIPYEEMVYVDWNEWDRKLKDFFIKERQKGLQNANM